MRNKSSRIIPIFFAVDDGYSPFLAVALESIIDNASSKNTYVIKVLYTNISDKNQAKIKKYEQENVSIEFVDLNYYIDKIKDKLYTRDYYSKTTYFRLFIPELYPQYTKCLYLDSDIVVLDDIAKLYNIEIGDNLVAAAPDDVIQTTEVFQNYAEKVVGVASFERYFNAGILVMNLDELRKFNFQEKFLYSLGMIKFSVAQDQDYLNRLCKGRVYLLDNVWDRMPIGGDVVPREELKIIHYNLAFKPWHFEDILYKEYFWKYAQKTEYFDDILKVKEEYSEEDKFKDMEAHKRLEALAQTECDCVGDDRPNKNNVIEKAKDRIEILETIAKYEKEGKFDQDVENDPPTIELTPEGVDYLNRKITSKVKTRFANYVGEKFLDYLVKSEKLLIKEIKGLENLEKISGGAVLTCNHFNPYDVFAVETAYREAKNTKGKKLFKVIREGNYTNFPGLYGFFFKNCDTLPLSSNNQTMVKFMKAADDILARGDMILIYPEQSLWWNYRKPKPLKQGGFRIAARNMVPVIPIFITMEDSNLVGDDGFTIQEYTINIGKPIYPEKKLSEKENTMKMKEKNAEVWKKVYEDFYKIPLVYTTDPNKMPS